MQFIDVKTPLKDPRATKTFCKAPHHSKMLLLQQGKEALMYRKAGHKWLIRFPSRELSPSAWIYMYFRKWTQIPSPLRPQPSKENITNINSNSWVSKLIEIHLTELQSAINTSHYYVVISTRTKNHEPVAQRGHCREHVPSHQEKWQTKQASESNTHGENRICL